MTNLIDPESAQQKVRQSTINISVNGEPRELEPCSLAAAIEQWSQQGQTFAVAVNEQFVPKGQYTSIQLQDSDRIELLVPMQGG